MSKIHQESSIEMQKIPNIYIYIYIYIYILTKTSWNLLHSLVQSLSRMSFNLSSLENLDPLKFFVQILLLEELHHFVL